MGRKSRSKQEGGMILVEPSNYSKLRLIADMKKDSIASINTVGADRFGNLLKAMFPDPDPDPSLVYAITQISSGSKKFIEVLHEVEGVINSMPEVTGEEVLQLNILKSDLVHACASDATYVFPETGLSPSKAVINPEKVIGTAAGYLDPGSGSTEINNLYMPDKTEFNKDERGQEILMRVGFPAGMSWKCISPAVSPTTPLSLLEKKSIDPLSYFYEVTIKYPFPVSEASNTATGVIDIDGRIDKESVLSVLRQLCLGNAEKNLEIETTSNANRSINLLLTKELGDVAQVLVYKDFIQKNSGGSESLVETLTKQSVMITTDHVVYMLCKEMNLSCIYTGAQKLRGTAKISGHTHIVTYTGGRKLDNIEKRKTTIKLYITNLIKYLQNKK